jgi:hypothetical protein
MSADSITSAAHSSGGVANSLPVDRAGLSSFDAYALACPASENLTVAKLSVRVISVYKPHHKVQCTIEKSHYVRLSFVYEQTNNNTSLF